MSRRFQRPKPDEPGGDSFLDVVANLVGILIILVMVVGAGTRSAAMLLAKKAKEEPAVTGPDATALDEDVLKAAEEAHGMQTAFREVEEKILQEATLLQIREQERMQVQTLVNVAEERLAEHRSELDDADREKYDIRAQLVSARSELERLGAAKQVASEKPPPQVLEHYPTPMAKTVFGTELHFRLKGGKIAYVHWDNLVAALKKDAPNQVSRLRDQDRVEQTLGPIGHFVMKYALVKSTGVVQTRQGTASGTSIQLERFVLIPVREPLGEPVRDALANPRSELLGRLNELGPRRATLTVWVYPDSFEDFRYLKGEMFKLGYLTAARPLPDGMPIGGSPDGSRSSAE